MTDTKPKADPNWWPIEMVSANHPYTMEGSSKMSFKANTQNIKDIHVHAVSGVVRIQRVGTGDNGRTIFLLPSGAWVRSTE